VECRNETKPFFSPLSLFHQLFVLMLSRSLSLVLAAVVGVNAAWDCQLSLGGSSFDLKSVRLPSHCLINQHRLTDRSR
jgi:hypothetical protein